MRIFTASLATETNTFSPVPTDRASFEMAFYAAPGHHPDARTHRLYGDHERPGEERRPEQGGAELRTGDGIRRDARWIVVRGTRDYSRAEALPEGCYPGRWWRHALVRPARGRSRRLVDLFSHR